MVDVVDLVRLIVGIGNIGRAAVFASGQVPAVKIEVIGKLLRFPDHEPHPAVFHHKALRRIGDLRLCFRVMERKGRLLYGRAAEMHHIDRNHIRRGAGKRIFQRCAGRVVVRFLYAMAKDECLDPVLLDPVFPHLVGIVDRKAGTVHPKSVCKSHMATPPFIDWLYPSVFRQPLLMRITPLI